MNRRSVVGMAIGLALVSVGVGPPTPPPSPAPSSSSSPAPTRSVSPPSQRLARADDRTFRPTVIVRCGTSQGSGTVIASLDGLTLVLTAAHVVVEGKGAIHVELHRYNLGLERFSKIAGGWPRVLPAEIAAADRSADLAILRIKGMKRLPYVARLTPGVEEPAKGTVVTSVGVDLGEQLSSWLAYVGGVVWFKLDNQEEERPFLVTTRPPEHGRSGGGLFLTDGQLVGVCVGRVEETKTKQEGVGIFASGASIRHLLRDHDLEETIARSDAVVRAAAAARRAAPSRTPAPTSSPGGTVPVTPTRARSSSGR